MYSPVAFMHQALGLQGITSMSGKTCSRSTTLTAQTYLILYTIPGGRIGRQSRHLIRCMHVTDKDGAEHIQRNAAPLHAAPLHSAVSNTCLGILCLLAMAAWVLPWPASMDPARMSLMTFTALALVGKRRWQMSAPSNHNMCHSPREVSHHLQTAQECWTS